MVEVLLVTYFIFDKNLSQAIVMAAGRSTQNVRTATNIEGHNRLELVVKTNRIILLTNSRLRSKTTINLAMFPTTGVM